MCSWELQDSALTGADSVSLQRQTPVMKALVDCNLLRFGAQACNRTYSAGCCASGESARLHAQGAVGAPFDIGTGPGCSLVPSSASTRARCVSSTACTQSATGGTASQPVNLMTAVNMALDRAMAENERCDTQATGSQALVAPDLGIGANLGSAFLPAC